MEGSLQVNCEGLLGTSNVLGSTMIRWLSVAIELRLARFAVRNRGVGIVSFLVHVFIYNCPSWSIVTRQQWRLSRFLPLRHSHSTRCSPRSMLFIPVQLACHVWFEV